MMVAGDLWLECARQKPLEQIPIGSVLVRWPADFKRRNNAIRRELGEQKWGY
jgi:hypothetical protein